MAGKVQTKKTQSKSVNEKAPSKAAQAKKVQAKNAQNKKDYNDVWVIAEQIEGVVNEVTVELLGEGRKLADKLKKKLVVVIAGSEISDVVERLMHYGVDSAIYIEHPLLKEYTTDGYAKVFSELILERKPEIILVGGTSIGKDLGPRIAAKIDTGITADCTKLEINGRNKKLMQTKPAFGGRYMATIVSNKYPQMVTIRPRLMDRAEYEKKKRGEIETIKPKLFKKDIRTNLKEKIERENKGVNLIEAKVIVSGGRGMKGQEGVELIQQLADKIGGVIGCSRAAVDLGWLDYAHQVGQTGTIVKPELYIACGISGSSQHIAGMSQARHVIAINKDRYAPIFSLCDYGIIGDMFEVIPAMIECIDKYKKFEF
ncbi:MAG: electron transfer flavoprotein subunit alpha/FixB family protein [Firmicutes bacterium]|nr:electron transfer flavoprotein subunit alpha/FixB family protein [Bacillota bacterium]